jgi:phosphodiesterase/alkaline phosphatase D-like protein
VWCGSRSGIADTMSPAHKSKREKDGDRSPAARKTISSSTVLSSDTLTAGKEEDRVVTMAKIVRRLQHLSIKNVLFLSGDMPFPYAVTLNPDTGDDKKLSYYEFGACSIVACDDEPETRRLAAQRIQRETSLNVKEVIPLMVGNFYGVLSISKSGRVKYNIYSSRSGNKKQWLEIKPNK